MNEEEQPIVTNIGTISEFDMRLEYDQNLQAIIDSIQNESVKHQLYLAFEGVPDYFFKIPASSTGKYHPAYALGGGGLYRHTLAAAIIAKDLVQLEMFELTDLEKDIVICALLLHDVCKLGIPQEKYTRFDHPLLAAKLVKERCTDQNFVDMIVPLIESHMGQWNTSKYSDVVLPKPETKLQKIVHLCDYLASRKYLEVIFNG